MKRKDDMGNAVSTGILKIAKGGMKVIYAPIKLFPRKDKSVFISRQSDRPSLDMELLRDRIAQVRPGHKVVILSRRLRPSLGYIVHTIRQMYHIATSKNVVLDSYCIPVSVLDHKKGLTVIQMWHAIGSMKCFGYAMLGKEEGNSPEVAEIFRMHRNYDYILISSMDFFKDFEEGFHAREEQIRVIPLPKADLLTNREYMEERREAVRDKYGLPENKKNILYCPTFRKKVGDRDMRALEALRDAIDGEKYNLLYKPHSLSELKVEDDGIIPFHGGNVDAMAIADYVISDYSSIIYEAGLAGVPVYLYAYDWDDYRRKRALNLDIERDVPTVFSGDPKAITAAIESGEYRWKEYEAFIKRNVTMPEGKCVDAILKLMGIEGEEKR